MRILHLGKYYYPFFGGIESIVKELCEGFYQSGHEVSVLCSDGRMGLWYTTVMNGVRVTKVGRFGTFLSLPIVPLYIFFAIFMARNSDVVHVHGPNPWAELAALFFPKHIKVVMTYHSDVVRQKKLRSWYAPLLKRFLNRADKIVVPTANHIKFSWILPAYEHKSFIIPFGIKTEELNLDQNSSPMVDELKARYGDFILFVGRLVSYKGINYLIKAMTEVDANLVIVGEGPEAGDLKSLAKSLNLEDKVHFLGRVESHSLFTAFYHACSVFCLPSIGANENFGVVQLEAMYCEKAVVTTNLESGVPLVGERGKTTLLVDPASVIQLQKSLSMLIHNPLLRNRMGKKGKERVMQFFTYDKMIQGHESCYEDLTGIQKVSKKAQKIAS